MAGPTLLQLREYTYRLLGDNADTRSIDSTNANYQTNANYPLTRVDAAINEARYWLASVLDFSAMRTSSVGNAVSGEVSFPTDFLCRLALRFRSSSSTNYGNPLPMYSEEYLDVNQPGWRDEPSTSTPRGAVLRVKIAGTMTYELIPALSATVTNGLLTTYQVKPTALSAKTDTADELQLFPSIQNTLIPYKAAALLDYDIDEKQGRKAYYEAQVQMDLAQCRRILNSVSDRNVRLGK